jgi:hypothetical protein
MSLLIMSNIRNGTVHWGDGFGQRCKGCVAPKRESTERGAWPVTVEPAHPESTHHTDAKTSGEGGTKDNPEKTRTHNVPCKSTGTRVNLPVAMRTRTSEPLGAYIAYTEWSFLTNDLQSVTSLMDRNISLFENCHMLNILLTSFARSIP